MARKPKDASVLDIIRLVEKLAPPWLSEEWDNCGLQVGDLHWPVRKIWVALDPLPEVIEAACQDSVDLVITHHPLIFKPLHRIDLQTSLGKIIAVALNHQTAIYAAHTNLDSAAGGINDVLARKIGLSRLSPLIPADSTDYAEPDAPEGLGRLGELDPPITLKQLVQRIRKQCNLQNIRGAGLHRRKVSRVAVCSGSGGGLLEVFLESDAEVYVSGDLKYHDARRVEDAGRSLIDIGHFPSEHLILQPLAQRLTEAVQNQDWRVTIEACPLERDPFESL